MKGARESKTSAGEPDQDRRRTWWPLARTIVVVAVLVFAGLVVLSYGLRSPAVLGKWVGPEIEAQAKERQIDLQIGAIGGVGLTGLRLYDVEIGVSKEQGSLSATTERIDIDVDVMKSISTRRPIVDRVWIDDVDVLVSKQGREVADREPRGAPSEDTVGVERFFSEHLYVEVASIDVQAAGISHSAHFSQLEAVADVSTRQLSELQGSGEVADFEVELSTRDNAVFGAIGSARIEEFFADLPVEASVEGVSVDLDELRGVLDTGDIESLGLHLHNLVARTSRFGAPLEMRAEGSRISGDGAALRWMADDAIADGGAKEYELAQLELAYRRDAAGFSFSTVVGDGRGGRVELEGQWHIPTSLVGINAWIDDFQWDGTMPWPFAGEPPVQEARVDGAFHGDIDLIHQLLSLDGRAQVRDLVVEFPLLADEPVEIDEMDVALPVTLDVRGRAFSIVGGTVSIGDIAPLGFDAQIVEAGGGTHVFHLAMAGDNIDADALAKTLPPAVVGVIAETRLGGTFRVGIEMAGHSAYPESLVMEVDLSGNVRVIEEARWGDREALQQNGVMLFDTESPSRGVTVQGQWRSLSELPTYLPAAVLSAEDTSFFDHDGLDWKGLRMAMVENIKERALVRGGSTITQQVAKNLFLSHDRTMSRKLQEAFLTWRVEETVTKEGILELYLNVVEWGPAIHGLYAASHYYFDHPPEELEPVEMVMLASILPNPIRFGGAVTAGYLPSSREDKMRRVLENMRFLDDLSWDQYNRAIAQLDAGQIGTLVFETCADDENAPEEATACDAIEVESRDGQEMTFEEWEVADTTMQDGWAPLTH